PAPARPPGARAASAGFRAVDPAPPVTNSALGSGGEPFRLWEGSGRCRIVVVHHVPARLAGLLVAAATLLAGCTGSVAPREATTEAAPRATWTPSATIDLTDTGRYAAALEDGVNATRAQLDVAPLQHDDCLAAVARDRAAAL